jgi:hypothetical protein
MGRKEKFAAENTKRSERVMASIARVEDLRVKWRGEMSKTVLCYAFRASPSRSQAVSIMMSKAQRDYLSPGLLLRSRRLISVLHPTDG